MAQENNTFIEELQKLLKNLQPLKYMPGAESEFEWVLMELERPIIEKLQQLHGVGGQFPGQPGGTGMGATGPTPPPMGMGQGLAASFGAGPPGISPGGQGGIAGPIPMPQPAIGGAPSNPLQNIRP